MNASIKVQKRQLQLTPISIKSSPFIPSSKTLGVIRFQSGKLLSYPLTTAWLRLQELHKRSVGTKGGKYRLSFIKNYSSQYAKTKYENSLSAILATIAISHKADVEKLLASLLFYIQMSESLQGLESPYLSCLNTVGRSGNRTLFEKGVALWGRVGSPNVLGGGHFSIPVLDTAFNSVGFLNQDQINLIGFSLGKGVTNDSGHSSPDFLGGLTNGGIPIHIGGEDVGMTEGGCAAIGAAAGAVSGAVLGATAFGIGAIPGFATGAVSGDIVGRLICGYEYDKREPRGVDTPDGDLPDVGTPDGGDTGPTEPSPGPDPAPGPDHVTDDQGSGEQGGGFTGSEGYSGWSPSGGDSQSGGQSGGGTSGGDSGGTSGGDTSKPDEEKPNPDDEKPNPDDEKPNPDDEKPNPDDEKPNPEGDGPGGPQSYGAHFTDTSSLAYGSGVSVFLQRGANGSIYISGLPQLAEGGKTIERIGFVGSAIMPRSGTVR